MNNLTKIVRLITAVLALAIMALIAWSAFDVVFPFTETGSQKNSALSYAMKSLKELNREAWGLLGKSVEDKKDIEDGVMTDTRALEMVFEMAEREKHQKPIESLEDFKEGISNFAREYERATKINDQLKLFPKQ
jgi:hypothetical protein